MSDRQEELRSAAAKVHLAQADHHVFLCVGPSCCTPEQGSAAWDALKRQIKQHGLSECQRSKVGCLRICCHGPTMVVYPEGTWYQGMTAERIPQFVDQHLVGGQPVREWVFAEVPLQKKE